MSPYKKIKLNNGKTIDEHRFIMERTLGRKLKRSEVVHHINGDKRDNRKSNLEIKKLSVHSREHRLGKKLKEETKKKLSLINRGEKSPSAKLSNKDVVEVRKMLFDGKTCAETSRIYNVNKSTIFRIKHKKTWKY